MTMAKRPKTYDDTNVPRLTMSIEAALRAFLRTPPPPAGDPSTRKKKTKKTTFKTILVSKIKSKAKKKR